MFSIMRTNPNDCTFAGRFVVDLHRIASNTRGNWRSTRHPGGRWTASTSSVALYLAAGSDVETGLNNFPLWEIAHCLAMEPSDVAHEIDLLVELRMLGLVAALHGKPKAYRLRHPREWVFEPFTQEEIEAKFGEYEPVFDED